MRGADSNLEEDDEADEDEVGIDDFNNLTNDCAMDGSRTSAERIASSRFFGDEDGKVDAETEDGDEVDREVEAGVKGRPNAEALMSCREAFVFQSIAS